MLKNNRYSINLIYQEMFSPGPLHSCSLYMLFPGPAVQIPSSQVFILPRLYGLNPGFLDSALYFFFVCLIPYFDGKGPSIDEYLRLSSSFLHTLMIVCLSEEFQHSHSYLQTQLTEFWLSGYLKILFYGILTSPRGKLKILTW